MKTRIVSAFIMIPLVGVVWLGGIPLIILAVVVGAMGIAEFAAGFSNIGIRPSKFLSWASLLLLYGIYVRIFLLNAPFGEFVSYMMLWFFITIFGSLIMVLFKEDHNIMDGSITMMSVFYIVFLSSHIVLIDNLPEGSVLIWLALLTSFGTDTSAYFSGMLFGKKKLCPALSPKKTVEGAIGGVIGSTLLCLLFAKIFVPDLIWHCMIIGILGSVFAQMGDLVASAFKRRMGIKDYGTLIPGHGGILDRFDSILFTTPMVYYYIILILYPGTF